MDAMVEAMKPYIGMIFAIWFISEVITAMFRLYRKKSYQDRRMANDAEHAKVTRAMRYRRSSPRRLPLRPLRPRPRGRCEAPRRPYRSRIARRQVGDEQPPDPM